MKFGKLRKLNIKGAVRVVYREGDEVIKESFRSIDAVPDKFDSIKIFHLAGCDNIMIETNKGEEPVAVRGIEARLDDKSTRNKNKKSKKDKEKKENKKIAEELGIKDIIIDPDIKNDPIDEVLDNESEE